MVGNRVQGMAIVAAADAASEFLAEAAVAVVCLGAAVPLTVRLVRRGPLRQPQRLPPGGSVWPLAVALGWGLFVWLMVPTAYVAWRGLDPAKLNLANLPPRDVAFLASVPHLAAVVALVTADLLIYRGCLATPGLSLRQAGSGVLTGAFLSAVTVPLVIGASFLIEWLYRAVGFTHPPEHDVLHVLGQASEPVVKMALIVGAVAVVPVSEELMFRGHVQTIMRRAFARLTKVGGDAAAVPPAWATWAAIVLASALFTSFHAPWTWPPIFLLSVCLGWVYERTGNLWASVAVHAAFNGVSTLIFLKFGGGS